MTVDGRCKYLRKIKPRYVKAGHKERSQLLDELEQVTGLHRKSLVRLLGGLLARKPHTRQRGKSYRAEVDAVDCRFT